jgi:hypothetical protein
MSVAHRWIVLAALLITGCGASPQPAILIGDVPVPAGVVLFEGAEENTLDIAFATVVLAYDIPVAQGDLRYYWLPSELTPEAVDTFYSQQLAQQGWTEADDSLLATRLWVRPSRAGEQRLALGRVPLTGVEGGILMIVLVTE